MSSEPGIPCMLNWVSSSLHNFRTGSLQSPWWLLYPCCIHVLRKSKKYDHGLILVYPCHSHCSEAIFLFEALFLLPGSQIAILHPCVSRDRPWLKKLAPNPHLFNANAHVDIHTLSNAPAKWHGLFMSLQPLISLIISPEQFAKLGHRSMDVGLLHPNRYLASRNQTDLVHLRSTLQSCKCSAHIWGI